MIIGESGMPFLSFFESHVGHLVERVKIIYNNKSDIDRLDLFKKEFIKVIRETEKQILMEQISNQFDLALWMKDKDSVFIFANKPCMNLILRSSNPTFKSNGSFDKNALAILCIKSDQATIEKGKDMRFIEFAVYEGGENMWMDIYKSPLRNPSGEIYGTLGSGINITKIVPDDIKEKYRMAQSIEIGTSVILTANKISEIIEEASKT